MSARNNLSVHSLGRRVKSENSGLGSPIQLCRVAMLWILPKAFFRRFFFFSTGIPTSLYFLASWRPDDPIYLKNSPEQGLRGSAD